MSTAEVQAMALARNNAPAKASAGRREMAATFAVGLILTSLGFLLTLLQQSQRIDTELSRRTANITAALQRTVEHDQTLLDAMSALLMTTRGGSRNSLRGLTAELGKRSVGLISLDWAPRVTADGVKSFEEAQWLDGLPDFRVHRGSGGLAPAPAYFPVDLGLAGGLQVDGVDLSPGADLAGAAALNSTIEYARTHRTAALSPPLRLQRGADSVPALLMLQPVFAQRGPGTIQVQSGDEPLGLAFALLEFGALLDRSLSELDRASLSVELRDAAIGSDERPVARRTASSAEADSPLLVLWNVVGAPPSRHLQTMDVGARRWALAITAGSRFVASHLTWTPWVVLVCGLVATSILGATAQAFVVQKDRYQRVRQRLDRERDDGLRRLNRLSEDLERERQDRRRTEESLFREKQQFRLMFNAVPAMIWYKDTKNRFLLVNEAGAASMGRTVAEVEGRPCSEILPGKAYDVYRDDLEVIQSGRPKLGIIEQMHLPGDKALWVRTDKLPEYDSMGRVVGLLVFAQDITERRNAESEVLRLNSELEQRVADRTAELSAANEELESFAYSVSHDLRTPLRSIDGFSQLVLDEFGERLDDSGRTYLERVRSASQRMGQLIDDLLRLTRVSRTELRREQVDLSALARQAAEELRRSYPQRRVDLLIEATPFAEGDPVLLLNVVENLVGNAWKFTAKAEEARIEFGATTTSTGKTAYYVRDNGVGFDMVYVDKLFGAFQRLHGHGEFEGSGIGLATVQLILRRHGGTVWAEGAAGKGATFYFTLA